MRKLLLLLALLSVIPSASALSIAEESMFDTTSILDITQKEEVGNLTVDITYPSFGIEKIDSVIRDYVTTTKNDFDVAQQELFNEDEPDYTPFASIDIDYTIEDNAGAILSVKLNIYTYLGGAHGTPTIQTFNFKKTTGELITLTNKKTLERVATLVRPALREYLDENEMGDETWMSEGTEPTFENYASYTFTSDMNGKITSVTFYFQAYQVAAYAAGMPAVKISKDGVVAFQ